MPSQRFLKLNLIGSSIDPSGQREVGKNQQHLLLRREQGWERDVTFACFTEQKEQCLIPLAS